MTHFFKKFYPTISLIGVIAFLSLASFKSLPSTPLIPHMDKVVHFCMYMALGYILLFDMSRTHIDSKTSRKERVVTFVVAVCMGGLMEILQGYFTESRSAEWLDMLANTAGAFTGVLLGALTLPVILSFCKSKFGNCSSKR